MWWAAIEWLPRAQHGMEEPLKAITFFRSDPGKPALCRWDKLANVANMILGWAVGFLCQWMRILALSLLAGPLVSGSCGVEVCNRVSVLTQHNNGERTGANLNEAISKPIQCKHEEVWDAVSQGG